MSKALVDSFVFKLFIGLLIFDAVTVIYLTPKVEQAPPQAQEAAPEQNNSQKDSDDINMNTHNADVDADDIDDPFRNSKSSDDVSGTLVIQHCQSHQAALDNIKTYINAAYPSVVLESSIYPLPPLKALVSKFCQYAHWIMLALNLFGDKIFGFLQMPYPAWYVMMKEKKMIVLAVVLIGTMFLGNIANKTDAFEVYLNGDLVYSKFQTGNVVTTQQLDVFLTR